jgi:hypothetical protein
VAGWDNEEWFVWAGAQTDKGQPAVAV